jgi:hypothetical protein
MRKQNLQCMMMMKGSVVAINRKLGAVEWGRRGRWRRQSRRQISSPFQADTSVLILSTSWSLALWAIFLYFVDGVGERRQCFLQKCDDGTCYYYKKWRPRSFIHGLLESLSCHVQEVKRRWRDVDIHMQDIAMVDESISITLTASTFLIFPSKNSEGGEGGGRALGKIRKNHGRRR